MHVHLLRFFEWTTFGVTAEWLWFFMCLITVLLSQGCRAGEFAQPKCFSLLCRYSALKTLGERKAAFNEYIQLRKKEEAEALKEKSRQAREDFIAMLDESTELKAATRYSAAGKLFEDDMRWHVWFHDLCPMILNYLRDGTCS